MRWSRRWIFLVAAIAFSVMLLAAMRRLPPYGQYRGPYGDMVAAATVADRRVADCVTAVTLDYRGLDTMGEEFILFTAVMAVTLLLRAQRSEEEDEGEQDKALGRKVPPVNDAVAVLGTVLFAFTVLYGFYIVLHGQLTPGGGFQGGVILGSAFLYVYLSGEHAVFLKVSPPALMEHLEPLGAGGYVVIGLLGMVLGSAFLQNVVPLGTKGSVLSGGTMPLLNLAIGIEVAAGFLLLLSEFLHQTVSVRRRKTP